MQVFMKNEHKEIKSSCHYSLSLRSFFAATNFALVLTRPYPFSSGVEGFFSP